MLICDVTAGAACLTTERGRCLTCRSEASYALLTNPDITANKFAQSLLRLICLRPGAWKRTQVGEPVATWQNLAAYAKCKQDSPDRIGTEHVSEDALPFGLESVDFMISLELPRLIGFSQSEVSIKLGLLSRECVCSRLASLAVQERATAAAA